MCRVNIFIIRMNRSHNQFTIAESSEDEQDQGHNLKQSFGQPTRIILDDDEIAGGDQITHLKPKATDPVLESYFNRSRYQERVQENKLKKEQQKAPTIKHANSIEEKEKPMMRSLSPWELQREAERQKAAKEKDQVKESQVKVSSVQVKAKEVTPQPQMVVPPRPPVPRCQKHMQEISLICCVSQWHCEALCVDCVPEHTESHNKNRSHPQLRKFDVLKGECLEKCVEMRNQLQLRKMDLTQILESSYTDHNMEHLRAWRQSVVSIFEVYFDQMESEYRERAMSVHMQKMMKLEVVGQEIDKVLNDLVSFENDINTQAFYLKGIANTFRLNVPEFINDIKQEVDRICKTHTVTEELRLNSVLVKYIHDNIGRLLLIDTPPPVSKAPPPTKAKPRSTKCPDCGTEMTYVSAFKKHLECPSCNKVKRPNRK